MSSVPPLADHPADAVLTPRELAEFIEHAPIGLGVPAQNLARMFTRGLATRKGGHGFGLHSSALAARDPGGSLTVPSQGAGRGAIFTVRIPLAPGTMKESV
jgi:sensor histidine kinase regulating citrate/malate metabolism